jgi:hypothetical protein
MAATDLLLQLVALEPKEPNLTWEDLCSDPMKLFEEFARRFVVNGNDLKSVVGVVRNDNIPEPKDRGRIWVKTSWPYAIGVLIDGGWKMDWGLSGYPANTPFLWKESEMDPVPGFIHKLTSDEITNYGLTNTSGSHEDKLSWWIFEPEEPAI